MAAMHEVSRSDLPKLSDQLKAYLPYSVTVKGIIDVGLRYDLLENRKIHVLTAEGTSLVVTTPMIAQGVKQSLSVFWDSDKDDDQTIAAALSTIPNFSWDDELFFYACPWHLLEKVEQMVRGGQLGTGKLNPGQMNPSHLFTLTPETMPPMPSLPSEFEVRPIDPEYSEHMLSFWEYRYSESAESYKKLLLALPGFAVFKTPAEGEAGGPPVSWTQLSKNNTMGNTFTLTDYRKRGLAKAVTLALGAHLLEQFGRTSVYIADDNEASVAFHVGLGFKRECAIGWQSYRKEEEGESHQK